MGIEKTMDSGRATPPDLVVESFTVTPGNPTSNDRLIFTAVVKNVGTGPAGPSKTGIRVGGESAPFKLDCGGLVPGGTCTVRRETAPLTAQGYQAEALADVDHAVNEANERNNSKSLSFQVIQVNPDLLVESFTVTPGNPTSNDRLIFTAVVKNVGTGPAGPSKTGIRVGGESEPFKLDCGGLVPGGTCTVRREIPPLTAQGYQAEALADVDNTVNEANERNNGKSLSFQVIQSNPDLVVESFTVTPGNPRTNDRLIFTAVVKNIGTGPAGPSKTGIRVGGESAPLKLDCGGLAPGGTCTVRREIPPLTAQGYQSEATADADNSVNESNERNNGKSLSFQVIQSNPDLVVDSFTVTPGNPRTNDRLIFTAVVKNIGTGPAGPSKTGIRVGGESAPLKLDCGGLVPGGTCAVRREIPPLTAQGYQAEAVADADNAVNELDEGNNSKTLVFSVIR